MWSIVTRSGSGNPKCSGANIHLLYKESMIAKVNLHEIVRWKDSSRIVVGRNTLDVPGCDEECVDERVAKP